MTEGKLGRAAAAGLIVRRNVLPPGRMGRATDGMACRPERGSSWSWMTAYLTSVTARTAVKASPVARTKYAPPGSIAASNVNARACPASIGPRVPPLHLEAGVARLAGGGPAQEHSAAVERG